MDSILKIFYDRRLQFWSIIICCFVLNANTVRNKYALDDEIIIVKNVYVQRGFAGIGKIFSSDALQSYLDQMAAESPLNQGRYRPLSIASFAVEQQLFGATYGDIYSETQQQLQNLRKTVNDPDKETELVLKLHNVEDQMRVNNDKIAFARHGLQVIFFTLAVLALFWFLSFYCFPENRLIPFVAILLFVFHPVHTEVVANLKSRDEIFSLLFISLTLAFFFRHYESKRTSDLVAGLVCLACALLSKEYAMLLFILLPLGIIVRYRANWRVLVSKWFIFAALLTGFFIMVRYSVISTAEEKTNDVLNDPYLYATAQQKIASEIRVLNEYLKVLVFPHPLSSDYSYSQFPYVTFGHWSVWLAIIVWLAIGATCMYLLFKRNILGFILAFSLGFFMLINNLLFDIGATMGERLIFHSSVGFCIVIAWLLVKFAAKFSGDDAKQRQILAMVLIVVLLPMGYKTIARNADWKNDFTLFTRDVNYVPNSALANGNAGSAWFNKGFDKIKDKVVFTREDSIYLRPYADKAIPYFTKAINVHPKYVTAYMNRGMCYMHINELDSAARDWIQASKLYTVRNADLVKNARLLFDRGNAYGRVRDFQNAARYLQMAVEVDKYNKEAWKDLGGALYMSQKYSESANAFKRALDLDPNFPDARNGYNAARQNAGLPVN